VVLTRLEERSMSGSELLRQVAQRRTETAACDLQRRAAAAPTLPGPHSAAVVCVALPSLPCTPPTPLHLPSLPPSHVE